jgi:hypothetical protein
MQPEHKFENDERSEEVLGQWTLDTKSGRRDVDRFHALACVSLPPSLCLGLLPSASPQASADNVAEVVDPFVHVVAKVSKDALAALK